MAVILTVRSIWVLISLYHRYHQRTTQPAALLKLNIRFGLENFISVFNQFQKFIQFNYIPLKVIGSVVGCHSNPTICFPIIIGSIPILDNPPEAQMNSNPGISYVPTAPILGNEGNPNSVPHPNEPSPSAPYPSDGKHYARNPI